MRCGDHAAHADHGDLSDASSTSPVALRVATGGGTGAPPSAAARSADWIRPPGPVPGTRCRSMPASRARRRVAGEAMIGRAWRRTRLRGRAAGGRTSPGRAGEGAHASTAMSVSNTASSAPTAIASPGPPFSESTRPVTGDGTSTTALSVDISTSGWSSATRVTRLDVPLDDLGRHRALAEIRQLEDVAAHAPALIRFARARRTRALPGKYSHSNACG